MELWKKELIRVWKQTLIYKKKVYLLLTPEHGNYGDHAIAMAEVLFLKKILPGYQVIEIQADVLSRNIKKFCFLLDGQLLLITGGGFWGTLWPRENDSMMDIIRYCKKSRIVIMPQTVFFENGRSCKKCKSSVEKHNNIHIFLRDEKSYHMIRQILPSKPIYMSPDMVLSMNLFDRKKGDRNGIMLCLKQDKEGLEESKKCFEYFKNYSEYMGERIFYGSTNVQVKRRISISQHEQKVRNKINEISRYTLIITDMLHAMLFCTVTATPCIAMESLSGKVYGGYKWVKDLPYIYYAKDFNAVLESLGQIDLEKPYSYVPYATKEFKQLSKVIKYCTNKAG